MVSRYHFVYDVTFANAGTVELEREKAATFVTKRDEDGIMDIMGRDVEDLWAELTARK